MISPLVVSCTYCNARPFERCTTARTRTAAGDALPDFHRDRAAAAQTLKHVPWTLSSDGRGRVTVVLGASYGTSAAFSVPGGPIPTSVEDMVDGRFDLSEFLRALVDGEGDLVGVFATGSCGKALFEEALRLLPPE